MTLSEAYQILEVERDASADAIKAAYRSRARATHPDRGGDPREFIRVQAAYEILCAVMHEPVGESDVPIPPELRSVVDAIMTDFRVQLARAEERTQRFFDSLEARMLGRVRNGSRAELREFSGFFRHEWHAGLKGLFEGLNRDYQSILGRYDRWFSSYTTQAFDDAYRMRLFGSVRSRRFLVLSVIAFLMGLMLGAWMTAILGVGGRAALIVRLAVGLAVAAVVPLGYWLRARATRPRPADLSAMEVQPFTLDARTEFYSTAVLKQGRRSTVAAGVSGFFLLDLLSAGIAGPILGGVAGLMLGGMADRVLNPTGSIRRSLEHEVRTFLPVARRSVTAYVLESHQKVMAELQDGIIRNYEQRVRETVKLLTAGSDRLSPGDEA